jgi:hypothetical protein
MGELTLSRAEADQRLRDRIANGEDLLQASIGSAGDLKDARL